MDDCHTKQSEDILLIIYWEKIQNGTIFAG
jgi:hypothetical protein